MIAENLIGGPKIFSLCGGQSARSAGGVIWTNPLEHSNWDRRVAGQSHSTWSFFHGTAWAKVLTETYGCRPIYFVINEPGTLHSLLPLMEVQSALTGKRAVALPFTDHCEPLCADKAGFNELFRNAIELGKVRGWKYLEFRGGKELLKGVPPSLLFYGHSVNLPADENVFFSELKSPVRRAIRKAEKSGAQVEISRDIEAVKDYYKLHCISRKKHGLPPQPFSFFKSIHKHILAKDLGIIVLARWNKVPVAGAVFFHTEDRAIYKFGASNESFQQLRANNLVFWEAIRWFSRRGFRKLDLGRTSIGNEGLRRFKLGWNAVEKEIAYFRFCLRHEKFISMPNESLGWHNGVFRRLPLLASRMAGEILYRHWA